MIPWILILIIMLGVFRIARYGMLITLAVLIVLAFANFTLIDRVVVHKRTGFRCPGCGYDLQGQTVDRCPECGGSFDLNQLVQYKAGGAAIPAKPRRSMLTIILITFVVLVTLFLVGLTRYRRTNPTPPPAMTPTTTQAQ